MAVGVLSNSVGDDHYPGKLTWFVSITCIVAAMGDLIFGYDIGISGVVTSMAPFLMRFLKSVFHQEELDHSTNQYCKFNSGLLTIFTPSLYLAALMSSFVASWATIRFGRRISMLTSGLVFLAGAILNACAVHISMLIIGRILLGFGVGFATQVCPVCAKRVGMDIVGHITAQHASIFKVQRKRRFHKGGSNSFSILRKELREGNLQSLFGGSSCKVSSSNTEPDSLLSSFINNLRLVDEPIIVQSHSSVEPSSVKESVGESFLERNVQRPLLSDKDQEEKARKCEFVRGLLLSTILDDGL